MEYISIYAMITRAYVIMFFSYDSSLADACADLAKKWSSASDEELSAFTSEDLTPFSSNQKREFLSQLLEEVRYLNFKQKQQFP